MLALVLLRVLPGASEDQVDLVEPDLSRRHSTADDLADSHVGLDVEEAVLDQRECEDGEEEKETDKYQVVRAVVIRVLCCVVLTIANRCHRGGHEVHLADVEVPRRHVFHSAVLVS